jgi:hypothetical protein
MARLAAAETAANPRPTQMHRRAWAICTQDLVSVSDITNGMFAVSDLSTMCFFHAMLEPLLNIP